MMKDNFWKELSFLVAVILFGFAALLALTARAQWQCGVLPPKPPPAVGCRDMIPECICDQWGQNCRWVWRCVQ
jgi:hypothetical protein